MQPISVPEIFDFCGLEGASHVSATINGAEVEMVRSLAELAQAELPRCVSFPGWYKRDGDSIVELTVPNLKRMGYEVAVTVTGAVFAHRG